MLTRLSRLVVLLAAVQALGGHWMALQSVAWIGMIAEYSRGETLVVAIEKTFDGDHPCGLCEVVKTGRDEEQRQEISKVMVKVEAILAPAAALPLRSATELLYPDSSPSFEVLGNVPLTPPPLRVA